MRTPDQTPEPHTNSVVSSVVDGRVLQAAQMTGDLTLVNTVVQPRPIQIPDLPAPGPRPEVEALTAAYREDETIQVIVLYGPPGSGKTHLAAHFLHAHRDRFEDGILLANLHGSNSEGPADTADVLDQLLRSIHVGADAIPNDLDGRAAAWRSYTYDRRVAVLADDAMTAAQVRTLFPGRGPSLVIVTTTRMLGGLLMDGATLVKVSARDRAATE